MRILLLVVFCLSGCTILDQIDFSGGRTFDPNKVYLSGKDTLVLGRYEDRNRYECISPPMVCDLFGNTWRCRCS